MDGGGPSEELRGGEEAKHDAEDDAQPDQPLTSILAQRSA
jgi:hypothetical protein